MDFVFKECMRQLVPLQYLAVLNRLIRASLVGVVLAAMGGLTQHRLRTSQALLPITYR